MQLSELRTAVMRRTGIDYDATALNDLINEALTSFSGEANWPWLERVQTITSIAGQAQYALPANWARTRSVNVNGDELNFISPRDADADSNYPGVFLDGDVLNISPAPGVSGWNIVHRYFINDGTLTVDTDTPLAPMEGQYAVIHLAASLVYGRSELPAYRGHLPKLSIEQDNYAKAIKRMRSGIGRTMGPRRPRVRPGGVFGQ